jgi:hypothetical protein
MVADETLEREDAGAAVLAGAGEAAHLGYRLGSLPDGLRDRIVVDDAALAHDHVA